MTSSEVNLTSISKLFLRNLGHESQGRLVGRYLNLSGYELCNAHVLCAETVHLAWDTI